MRTIVQEYGPIYGETINGTVMGRPNGSVYVPLTNKISLTVDQPYLVKWTAGWGGKYYALANSDGTGYATNTIKLWMDAESQDLASSVSIQIFSDAALTTMVGRQNYAAGIFNGNRDSVGATDYDTPQTGDTLYMVAYLDNGGQHIAASTAIELELVEASS